MLYIFFSHEVSQQPCKIALPLSLPPFLSFQLENCRIFVQRQLHDFHKGTELASGRGSVWTHLLDPGWKSLGKVTKVFRWDHIPPVLFSTLQPMVPGCPLKGKAVVKKQKKQWIPKMGKSQWGKLATGWHSHSIQPALFTGRMRSCVMFILAPWISSWSFPQEFARNPNILPLFLVV